MTSVANTVAMTTLAVHTLQPLIFYTIYIPTVPSAERRAHPFPPVEMLLPASVDRFPCFHTCPAYEQKKRAIPGRIFLIAIYIPMVPSAERRAHPFRRSKSCSPHL